MLCELLQNMFQTDLDPFNLDYPPMSHPCRMKPINQVETTAGNRLHVSRLALEIFMHCEILVYFRV